jgi:hypothetical protein
MSTTRQGWNFWVETRNWASAGFSRTVLHRHRRRGAELDPEEAKVSEHPGPG